MLDYPLIRQYSCDEKDMFIEQSKSGYKVTIFLKVEYILKITAYILHISYYFDPEHLHQTSYALLASETF